MSDQNRSTTTSYLWRVVDRVPSMLAYWDKDLRCRFANEAYRRWFGADPAALIGTTIDDLLGPDLFGQNKPYIDGALRGEEQLFERIVPGPDGVQRHSLANYIPDVVDGRIDGFLVQVTEITQLRKTEAALEREHVLRIQIERHAEALDNLLRERDELIEILAHEVRQPLNNASAAMQSAAGALNDGGRADVAPRLMRAQAVMGDVLATIDNTLAAARLIAAGEPITRLDTDVETLVAVAIGDMPAGARDRIRVDYLASARTALMDMGLMRLALRNLLANALKFSPADSPVTVTVTETDRPLAVVIDVTDAGAGVDPAVLPRLFERGISIANGRGQSRHGLGLFIVRRVMQLHGGTAALVHSAPGRTTFRMVLDQSACD